MGPERKEPSDEANPYSDFNEFFTRVVPLLHPPIWWGDLPGAMEKIRQSGRWSETLGRALEAAYLSFRGRSQNAKAEERASLKTQYVVRVIAENIDSPHFDAATFREICLKGKKELGSSAFGWLFFYYTDLLKNGIDLEKFYQAAKSVATENGKRLVASYIRGVGEAAKMGVDPEQLAQAVTEINRKMDLGSARAFALNIGKVLVRGDFTVQTFAEFVLWQKENLGVSTARWLARFAAYERQNEESDYGLVELAEDARALMDHSGEKLVNYFLRGASYIAQVQGSQEGWIQTLKTYDYPPYSAYEDHPETGWLVDRRAARRLWRKAQAVNLGAWPKFGVLQFRSNFAELLARFGEGAATHYALADLSLNSGDQWPEFVTLHEAITKYIETVGIEFANRTWYVIARITGNYPHQLQLIYKDVAKAVKKRGEKATIKDLWYTYAASRRGGPQEKLLRKKSKPKRKKTKEE